jgi:hypothetical protein
MVGHQTIGKDAQLETFAVELQEFEVEDGVSFLQEDIELPHSSLSNVMRDFGEDRPCHSRHRCSTVALASTPLRKAKGALLSNDAT